MTVETVRFADLLRGFREQAGLSQSRLARIAGLDHTYLSRLENGQRIPTRRVVLKLAEALGVDPVKRDQLLVAAGLAPVSALTLAVGDELLEQAARLLMDASVPAEVRMDLRVAIRIAVSLAERAATQSGVDRACA